MNAADGRPDEFRRVGGALLGAAVCLVVGASVGAYVGSAFGGGTLALLVVAIAAAALFAAASHPVLVVAVVPFAVGFGNDPIPGLPGGLQAVHVLIGIALGALGLHVLLADGRRLARPDPRTTATMLAVLAFTVGSLLSGLLGRTPYVSLAMNLMLLGVVIVAVATVLVTTSVDALRGLLCVVVAASVAATAPVLGQLDGVTSERGGAVVDNRPTGVFVDPNELGAYAVVVLVLALTLLAPRGSRWWEVVIGGVGAAFAATALVLSFSRGSWIAGAVAVAVLLGVPSLRARLLGVIGTLGCLATLLVVTGVVLLPVDAVYERATSLLTGSANPYDARPYIWETAIQGFLDAPLLGAGPGSFPSIAADPSGLLWAYPVVHAHSGALTIAVENGIVGLLAALAVIVLVTRGLLRTIRLASVLDPRLAGTAAGLLAALIGIGVSMAVDYTLRNPLVLATAWLVVGLAMAAGRLGEKAVEGAGDVASLPVTSGTAS
jgi:putative inorganic carbon (hco3(-)) transporter